MSSCSHGIQTRAAGASASAALPWPSCSHGIQMVGFAVGLQVVARPGQASASWATAIAAAGALVLAPPSCCFARHASRRRSRSCTSFDCGAAAPSCPPFAVFEAGLLPALPLRSCLASGLRLRSLRSRSRCPPGLRSCREREGASSRRGRRAPRSRDRLRRRSRDRLRRLRSLERLRCRLSGDRLRGMAVSSST